jgi:hypothetical protein
MRRRVSVLVGLIACGAVAAAALVLGSRWADGGSSGDPQLARLGLVGATDDLVNRNR